MRPLLALLLVASLVGCTRGALIDRAMSSAPHTAATNDAPPVAFGGPYKVLAGDIHCHVAPPDSESDVSRTLPRTVELAKKEGLDFVVLTPHVQARFFANPKTRAWVVESQRKLRELAASQGDDVVLIPGMEYTDHRYGHVGVAFADLDLVLAEVAANDPPERFFERWQAHDGVLTINHPVLKPLPNAPFGELRADLSWRGFDPKKEVPSEIAWITAHAMSVETFNLSVTHLRDRFVVGDEERSLREAASLVDRTARAQKRRIAVVGGSDSHGDYLRATTWVLATEKSAHGVRDAIANGRTCVRGPAACSFEARAPGDRWLTIGTSLLASGGFVEARSSGGRARYIVNGTVAARANAGEIVRVPVPESCSLLRAIVNESWSSPVYVNCPLMK